MAKEEEKEDVVDLEKELEKKTNTSQNYTHTFSQPVKIEGKEYKKITFYFDRLTGMDMEAIEEEMMSEQKYALTPETSTTYRALFAARAAGIASDEIRRLPAKDYLKITNVARDFLIAAGY